MDDQPDTGLDSRIDQGTHEEKTLAQISVKDICEKAGIQRPTFYYYFQDKYDLAAWIFLSDAKDKDITSITESTQSLNHMKEEYVFCKRSYEDISQNPLWQYMLDYFVERYTQIALERAGSDVLSPQLSFDIRLYCYGRVAMTKEWLLYDNITSAATEAAMHGHRHTKEELEHLPGAAH